MSDKYKPEKPSKEGDDDASNTAKPLETLPKWHPYNVQIGIRNKAAKKKADKESDQKEEDAHEE